MIKSKLQLTNSEKDKFDIIIDEQSIMNKLSHKIYMQKMIDYVIYSTINNNIIYCINYFNLNNMFVQSKNYNIKELEKSVRKQKLKKLKWKKN